MTGETRLTASTEQSATTGETPLSRTSVADVQVRVDSVNRSEESERVGTVPPFTPATKSDVSADYAFVVDEATTGYIRLDPWARITYMNASAGRFLGVRPEMALGHCLDGFESTKDIGHHVHAQVVLALNTVKHPGGRFQQFKAQLSELVDVRVTPIFQGEKLTSVFVRIADTSHISVAQSIDQHAESLLESAMASAELAVAIFSLDGITQYWSPQMERLTHVAASSAVGRMANAYFPPELAEEVTEPFVKILSDPSGQMQTRIIRARFLDAPLVHADWRILRDSAGRRSGVMVICQHVTAAAAAQNELAAIRQAMEHTPEMFFRVTREGGVVEVSKSVMATLGYSREKLLRSNVIHIDTLYPNKEMMAKGWSWLERTGYFVGETEYRRADGSTVPVEVSIHYAALLDQAFCFARDISKRKRLEREVGVAADQFRAYFDNSPYGIIIRDSALNVLEVNAAIERITGYRKDELIGQSIKKLVHPNSLEIAKNVWDHFSHSGESVSRTEGMMKTKGGDARWVTSSVSAFPDASGKARFLVAVEDIHERKLFQEKLEAALLAQAAILETTSAGVVQIRQGEIELCNTAFERMFGYQRGEMIGMHIGLLLGGSEKYESLRAAARDFYKLKETFTIEAPLITRSGARLWCRVYAKPIDKKSEIKQIILTFHDITESRANEQRLEKALIELETMFQTTFVGICHMRDGKIARANLQLEKLFGYASGELLGQSYRILFQSDDDWKSLSTKIDHALMEKGVFTGEAALRKKDGGVIHCLLNTGLIERSDPSLPRISAFIDITARVESERALAESNRRIYALFDSVPDAIWFKDAAGRFQAANQEFLSANARLLRDGISTPDDIVGKTSEEVFTQLHPEARITDLRTMQSNTVLRYEKVMPLSDGQQWVEITKAPLVDEDGLSVGLVGVSRDVSEARNHRDEMARLLREQEVLFDMASVGIAYLSGITIVRCNRRFAQILGYEHAAMSQFDAAKIFGGAEDAEHVFMLIRNGVGNLRTVEQQLRRADGSAIWCGLNANPLDVNNPISGYILTVSDITDAKNREQALQVALREQEVILKNALVGVAFVRRSQIVRMNDDFCGVLGYEEHELREISIGELFADESAWRFFKEAMTANLVIACTYLSEQQFVKKDGTLIWCVVQTRSVDTSHPLDEVIFTLLDITLRKESEDRLASARNFLDSVIDNLPNVVAVRDAKTHRYLRFNRAGEALTGLLRANIIGKTPNEIYPSDTAAELNELDRRVIEGGNILEDVTDITYRAQGPKHGSKRLINRRAVPIRSPDGEVAYVMSVSEDITERIKQERALRESELRFRQFAARIDSVIFLSNPQRTRWDYFNQQMEDVWGMPVDEIISSPLAPKRVVHPDDVHLFFEASIKESKLQPVDFEARLNHPTKGARWIRMRTFPMAAEGDEIRVFGLIDDITERKDEEQARIDRLIEQRDVLVREVHHRIKNNLQGVAGLLQHASKSRPELKPHLNEVSAQIQAIAQVHGLQVRAGQALRLRALAKAIFDNLARILPAPVVLSPPDASLDLYALPEQEAVPVALVLNELGTNGVKHGSDGVRVSMLSPIEGTVEFRLENKGTLPLGFDFERVTSHASGIGLIKALVPRRGGKVTFSQADNTVVVCLQLSAPAVVIEGAATATKSTIDKIR